MHPHAVWLAILLWGCAGTPVAPPAPMLAQGAPGLDATSDTTFLDGPQLAGELLHNLVRVDSAGAGEHGFGLFVGADEQHVYVLTAGHVVAAAGEAAPQAIRLRPCTAGAAAGALQAWRVEGFDPQGHDLALLRAARPAGYTPRHRALSPSARVRAGEPAWLLGRDGDCALVPVAGAIGSLVGEDVLVDLKGVRGGSSGAPLLSGHGIFGIAKDSDDVIVVAHSIDHAMRLVRAQRSARWDLQDARNVPPTSPQAAQVDLAETLNRYLFAVRDVHALLQLSAVARQTFSTQVDRYNAAVNRFRDAREKYDGTLVRAGGPPLLEQWTRVRERLWDVHLAFFALNEQNAQIFQSERSTPELRARMQALEPQLSDLERAIRSFLADLHARSLEP